MKLCGSWLFVGFVLAILLLPGLHPVRPTSVFLDSPIGRASCLEVTRPLVPAVAVVAKLAKFSLEARPSRAGPRRNIFRCFPTSPSAITAYTQTIPVRLGSSYAGPRCWFERLPRLKLQGPPAPPAGLRKRETTRQNPQKPGPQESGFCNV